jgi:hypothetical protein
MTRWAAQPTAAAAAAASPAAPSPASSSAPRRASRCWRSLRCWWCGGGEPLLAPPRRSRPAARRQPTALRAAATSRAAASLRFVPAAALPAWQAAHMSPSRWPSAAAAASTAPTSPPGLCWRAAARTGCRLPAADAPLGRCWPTPMHGGCPRSGTRVRRRFGLFCFVCVFI